MKSVALKNIPTIVKYATPNCFLENSRAILTDLSKKIVDRAAGKTGYLSQNIPETKNRYWLPQFIDSAARPTSIVSSI